MSEDDIRRSADGERYLIVPCATPGAEHLAVIWDRHEQQVSDVIDLFKSAAHASEQAA